MISLLIFLVFVTTTTVVVLGQCNYDQNCWRANIGCTLANGNPFERRAFISCDECLQLCLQRKDGPPPYCCKAVVYDAQWKFCDLFAVQAVGAGDLIQYPGRVYLSPSGNCTPATPAIVDCPEGQRASLSIFQNSSSPALLSSGTPINADSSEKCGLLCVQNKDDKGNPFQCKAALFSQGKCYFTNQTVQNSLQTMQPGPDENTLYLEKKCYPKDQATQCPSIVLDPHHLLVGYNRKTVDASSYEQCLQQCISAQQQFQFKCNSGQYYADVTKDNCVLNEETRATKPDVYLATDDNNIYFEPQCDNAKRLIFAKLRKAKLTLRDVPDISNIGKKYFYSDWSKCDDQTGMMSRKRCVTEKERFCGTEKRRCINKLDYEYDNHLKDEFAETECLPIKTPTNRSHCTLGVKFFSDGMTKEYCQLKYRPKNCFEWLNH